MNKILLKIWYQCMQKGIKYCQTFFSFVILLLYNIRCLGQAATHVTHHAVFIWERHIWHFLGNYIFFIFTLKSYFPRTLIKKKRTHELICVLSYFDTMIPDRIFSTRTSYMIIVACNRKKKSNLTWLTSESFIISQL